MKQELKDLSMKLRKDRSPLASTVVFHLSEVAKIGKAKNRETTDDEALQYVKKAVQKLKENEFSNKDELLMLETLMPKMASEAEVKAFLDSIDTSNKGAVMKAVKEKFGVMVDMKMVAGML